MKNNIFKFGLPIFALFITMGMFQNCGEQKFGDLNRNGDLSSEADADAAAAAEAEAAAAAAEEAAAAAAASGAPTTPTPPMPTVYKYVPGALVGIAGKCGVVINSAGYPTCNSVCTMPGQEKVCATTARILCVSPQPLGSAGELRLSVCQ